MAGGADAPEPLAWTTPPEAVLAGWPAEEPVAAIWSAAQRGAGGLWSTGWTILARPVGTLRIDAAGRATWLDPRTGEAARPAVPATADPLATLGAALAAEASGARGPRPGVGALPFIGGWIGVLSYDLGGHLEPAVRGGRAGDDRGWPLVEWHRCPAAYIHDGARWWRVGPPEALPRIGAASEAPWRLGPMRSATGREAFEAQVARVVEYIRAGDIYQANIAHRLSGAFEGSARGLFLALARAARPRHGAYVETAPWSDGTRRIVASASPELFAEVASAGGRVVTRPMKGTRPAGGDPRELEAAEKDRAELSMIVDLMRNDLGRVCRFGTVRVEEPRGIEWHGAGSQRPDGGACIARGGAGRVPDRGRWSEPRPGAAARGAGAGRRPGTPGPGGVWQAVGTVAGVLREGLGVVDLLRAAFPGGSVTGAPKIRAMRIIDELEPVARGPYCGAVGFVGDDGRAAFNIAIRTALLGGVAAGEAADGIAEGLVDYSVGAGIVADSRPAAEWRETMDKAGVLGGLAAGA